MNIGRMNEFILIAREGSFQKAARKLGVSPAVLSARFSSFEEGLGVKLLDRSAHWVKLTEEGHRFYTDCCEICEDYEKAVRRGSEAAYGEYMGLKIVVMGFEIPVVLRYFLIAFNQKHPNLHIELLDDSFCAMEEGLNEEIADIYFGYFIENYDRERIEHYRVSTMRQYIFVPKGHWLAGRNKVSFDELSGECFILYPETKELSIRNKQKKILEDAGISYLLYDDRQAKTFFQHLVTIGKGITMYPLSSLAAAPPDSIALLLDSAASVAELQMFFLKHSQNPAVRMFIDEFTGYYGTMKE